jgi:hypothetical protein
LQKYWKIDIVALFFFLEINKVQLDFFYKATLQGLPRKPLIPPFPHNAIQRVGELALFIS